VKKDREVEGEVGRCYMVDFEEGGWGSKSRNRYET
jgi:hypothetical protein